MGSDLTATAGSTTIMGGTGAATTTTGAAKSGANMNAGSTAGPIAGTMATNGFRSDGDGWEHHHHGRDWGRDHDDWRRQEWREHERWEHRWAHRWDDGDEWVPI